MDDTSCNSDNNSANSEVEETTKSILRKGTASDRDTSDTDDDNDNDNDNDNADDSSTDSTNNSSFLLNPNDEQNSIDGEGIALLRQIFPEESTDALRELHRQHVEKQHQAQQSSPEEPENENHRGPTPNNFPLPDDFLRLPNHVAVRRSFTTPRGEKRYRYELVDELHRHAVKQYPEFSDQNHYFTVVIERREKIGLGLSLRSAASWRCVQVVGLPQAAETKEKSMPNPAAAAGIRVNDYLIGINGTVFCSVSSKPKTLLRHAVKSLQDSQNPVVLHFQRCPESSPFPPVERTTSLLDSTSLEDPNESVSPSTCSYKSSPAIHPFAKALTARSLIQSIQDEKRITRSIRQFTERARQWESAFSFRIDGTNHTMIPQFDPRDLPAEMAELFAQPSSKKYNPSTPTLAHDSPLIPQEYTHAFFGMEESANLPVKTLNDSDTSERVQRPVYPGTKAMRSAAPLIPKRPDIFVPLYGVRKALSPRIVNIFVEGDTRVAYTVWVYDVESGKEWYAPIRYFQDFSDLRTATMSLAPQYIGELELPKSKFFFRREANEPEHVRQAKSRQLEHFLRGLCSMIYTCQPLNPEVAEIAVHVQSFLGVEAGLAETDFDQQRSILERSPLPNHNMEQWETRIELKRSLQRYTWRLFLLNTTRAIVNDFVDTARARGPKLKDIESMEARGRNNLKARALSDLERIQNFLDQLVDLILDGCQDDLQSIASRREYDSIRTMLDGGGESLYWDRLVREAVREQVEIEVYVPLRSVVSRLLVNGWRHEDMEVQFKIKELRKRPQGMFRIPRDKISPSHWQSVALILKRGVGMSTLPCAKLRAIVEAAREISRLHERERGSDLLGADDFLPIFIFCVVRAEMERPSALCILLRTLCDRINRIGEIGYFLASFEAAIAHIQEIDLTEDTEEMLSFLTVPLTEVSLEDSSR